ncbi:Rieske 2Fe-2S domain-containing protein [Dissulfurirhabdus thermomarina]|uniref:Rieske 2Fe-2S domain-containing protein n=1 Tax=Dissulfurirhabdus thermomarina TaxID=1765737 RepID=A0A6N9TQV4_DISTH|nr:Rieske 2Fe-2S domain-containing protein [Dissulfurirhabdus thermomarina]NDY43448.1 Rieske 2Fe-2S domain-containing protein [Dissulfurirhabdus thermomarina]NMX22634.1 Rieske 2Fe-2S domain-containing protein [Dissulfurirhabdus thermomarina]
MTRRDWLKRAAGWALGVLGLYPFAAFVTTDRVRPPRTVRIRKELKPGQYLLEPDFCLFETEAGPMAVSRRCPHLGCRITYHPVERGFICPCHQSRFTWDGRYVSGPAKKDLPRLGVRRLEDGGYAVVIPRGLG